MPLPKHAEIWLPGYLASRWRRNRFREPDAPIDVIFCVADHFEPENGGATTDVEIARVERWLRDYPRLVKGLADDGGWPPRHTFFVSVEEDRPHVLERLADLVRRGLAEIEVHLHHDHDTSANLRRTLLAARQRFGDLGLMGADGSGALRYAFVHGDWALDNALSDGRGCGVNDELSILMETGCHADFTMPAVPSAAQTRMVNSLYLAVDDPARPRSHDRGRRVSVGDAGREGLLMIQGPMRVRWDPRQRWRPRIDCGALDHRNHPTAERFLDWVDAGIGVEGRPEWRFVKVHAHGATDANAGVMLGSAMRRFHEALHEERRSGWFRLHYVTAREMANIVRAAMSGASGDPGRYRDFDVGLPPASAGG